MWKSFTLEGCTSSFCTGRFDYSLAPWCESNSRWWRDVTFAGIVGEIERVQWEANVSVPARIVLENLITRSALHWASIQGETLPSISFKSNLIHILSHQITLQPLIFEERKKMFLIKYSTLFEQNMIQPNRAFGVVELKHLCRFVSVFENEIWGKFNSNRFQVRNTWTIENKHATAKWDSES